MLHQQLQGRHSHSQILVCQVSLLPCQSLMIGQSLHHSLMLDCSRAVLPAHCSTLSCRRLHQQLRTSFHQLRGSTRSLRTSWHQLQSVDGCRSCQLGRCDRCWTTPAMQSLSHFWQGLRTSRVCAGHICASKVSSKLRVDPLACPPRCIMCSVRQLITILN